MSFRPRPIHIIAGDIFAKPFRRKYTSSGAVINFADHGMSAARLQIRDKPREQGGVVLVELSTANGGISLGKYTDAMGKEWSGQLYMSGDATEQLVGWGDGVYQLKVYDPAYPGVNTRTIFWGPVILVPLVTEV